MDVDDVGPVVAFRIRSFFEVDRHLSVIQELIDLGVQWPDVTACVPENGPDLSGQIWVLTGTLVSVTRDEASEKLRALGARVSGSVSA